VWIPIDDVMDVSGQFCLMHLCFSTQIKENWESSCRKWRNIAKGKIIAGRDSTTVRMDRQKIKRKEEPQRWYGAENVNESFQSNHIVSPSKLETRH
jgi:hypothetical protein